jgi:uncharacterized OB-fold protein
MKDSSNIAQEAGAPAAGVAPALPHLTLASDGRHFLSGMRCDACGTVVEGIRLACPSCGERRQLETIALSTRGSVHTCTLIHRSYPGVEVPFFAAVVDLDGGGTVRGTLTGVDPSRDMPVGQRVAMVFADSGQRDRQGRALIAYRFVPEGGAR